MNQLAYYYFSHFSLQKKKCFKGNWHVYDLSLEFIYFKVPLNCTFFYKRIFMFIFPCPFKQFIKSLNVKIAPCCLHLSI